MLDCRYIKHWDPVYLNQHMNPVKGHELNLHNLKVEFQKGLPVIYKGLKMDIAYRLDLLVEDKVIIEIKSVERLNEIHMAQILILS